MDNNVHLVVGRCRADWSCGKKCYRICSVDSSGLVVVLDRSEVAILAQIEGEPPNVVEGSFTDQHDLSWQEVAAVLRAFAKGDRVVELLWN